MGEATILIVEDEIIVANNIKSRLEQIGYTVPTPVSSGEEAIENALKIRPDLIVMDIKLAGSIDGIDAANEIQSKFDIPIIYLTAYGDESIVERVKKTYPYGYIIKPFKISELDTNIRTTLHRFQRETALRQREQWLSEVLESIGDAVVVTDSKGSISYLNSCAESMLQLSSDQSVGEPLSKIMEMITPNKYDDAFLGAVIHDKELVTIGVHEDIVLQNEKTQEIPVHACMSPVVDEDGDVKGGVLIFRDISKQKQAERVLKQSNEILEQNVESRTQELVEANRRLTEEIVERKKAEERALHTKENLRNIIDSTEELIFSFDDVKRIRSWNKAAESATGYKSREVMGRYLDKLPMIGEVEELSDLFDTITKSKKPIHERISFFTKKGERKIIDVSGSVIKGSSESKKGTLFVGRDITSEWESHKQILFGSSYLIPDKRLDEVEQLVVDLVRNGHQGLVITRGALNSIKNKKVFSESDVVLLGSQNVEGFDVVSSLVQLQERIISFCSSKNNGSFILLDGMHYMLTKFSFNEFVGWLFNLTEQVALSQSLLLVRLDPSLVDEYQMGVLENELQVLHSPNLKDIRIDDNLAELLVYIKRQNEKNASVSLKKVMSAFDIVYLTAAKRIKSLEAEGLVVTKRQGKSKTVHITEKGQNLLLKRNEIEKF